MEEYSPSDCPGCRGGRVTILRKEVRGDNRGEIQLPLGSTSPADFVPKILLHCEAEVERFVFSVVLDSVRSDILTSSESGKPNTKIESGIT